MIHLHIGMMKTGTTSIQRFLHDNREPLRERGLLFPRTPGETAHTGLTCYALPDNIFNDVRGRHGVASKQDLYLWRDWFTSSLQAEIDRCPGSDLVLSCEQLASVLKSSSDVERLLECLSRHGESIRLILYVRAQDRAIESFYGTNVKNGATHPLSPVSRDHYFSRFDYLPIYERWATLLGTDAVHVRIFSKSQLLQGDVIDDFTSLFPHIDFRGLSRPKRENESIGRVGIEVLRTLNDLVGPPSTGGKLNLRRGPLGNTIASLDTSPKQLLSNEERRTIYAWFRSSNQELEKKLGLSSDTIFPEPEQIPTEASSDDSATVEEILAIFAGAWMRTQELSNHRGAQLHLQRAREFLREDKLEDASSEARKAIRMGDVDGLAFKLLTSLNKRGM